MDYKEATEYLYRQLPMFSRVGAAAYKPGLDTSIRLDKFFGNPHREFKSIHVGGTNGKGSTSHLFASVLQEQGYKVGLYTSPHLIDYRERIRINGEMISKDEVIDFVKRFINSGYAGKPSFFELTMMMAFDCFARNEVDYAVIEVGMGGRLDSTNIITPEMCVITNISKDHTQFLGDTLEKIAAEKAGIIKRDIPVVIGEASGSVREVFEKKAMEEHAPIVYAQDSRYFENAVTEDNGEPGWELSTEKYGKVKCPLSGFYQLANFSTVFAAVEVARQKGIEISNEAVKSGFENVIANTGLAGRWMKLGDKPYVICDTGHNIAGINYNMQQVRAWHKAHPEGEVRFVIGFVSDKDVESVLKLLPADASYYLTQAAIPRAMAVEELKEKFVAAMNIYAPAFATVPEAFKAAMADAGESDMVYVGGSTFVVADLLAWMRQND